jgi:hypothetical protein
MREMAEPMTQIDLSHETHIVSQALKTVNKLHSDYIYIPFQISKCLTCRWKV